MTTIQTHKSVCPNCNDWTTVEVSEGALGAVANCECGNSWFVSSETGDKPESGGKQ
jgi:hypothetical protein